MNSNEGSNQTHPLITAEHLRRKAVVYCRQSTEQQVLQNTGSTDYQRSLAEVARSLGWQDSQIEIIEDDLGKSGSSSEGRTGWQRLQGLIDAGEVGAVFVANVSRLSRQVYDFEVFRLRAALHHTLLYSDGRLSDPANSNDAIVSQLMAIVASFENRKRAEIMMQSRLAKAKRGEAVSRLPVGWTEGPNGKFDYDPETKDTIRRIIQTFWQTRSVRRTVKALAKAGIKIPCRKRGGRLYFSRPTCGRVIFILTDPAYAGFYTYGKTQSQHGGPVLATGQSKRVSVSQKHWIKVPDHHPAYISLEEQEEVKSILAKNNFKRRHRPGRGRAVVQGLLRCGVCGATLLTYYPGKVCMYSCGRLSGYAEKLCMSFTSHDLEECILREVFKVLRTPPLDMLKSALEAARKEKQTRLSYIQLERERLAYQERLARDRADRTQGKLEAVHEDALQKLEKILREKAEFERKIALERVAPSNDESEQELEKLCRLATDVPNFWQHEAMTYQERKEILRCLIDHIVIAVTTERIDATIVWKSGAKTSVFVWRGPGRHHLIRELHAKDLTAQEIKEHLAAGNTSTGQVVNLSLGKLMEKLRNMGLKPRRYPADYHLTRQKVAELYRNGRSHGWIARYLNEQGITSTLGKSWNAQKVYRILWTTSAKTESYKSLHRRVIEDALKRGLDCEQMALDFNERNIRRRGNRTWTAVDVANACSSLKLIQRDPKQKESTSTTTSENSGSQKRQDHECGAKTAGNNAD